MNIYNKGESLKVIKGEYKQLLTFNDETFQSIKDLNSFQIQERQLVIHKKQNNISMNLL